MKSRLCKCPVTALDDREICEDGTRRVLGLLETCFADLHSLPTSNEHLELDSFRRQRAQLEDIKHLLHLRSLRVEILTRCLDSERASLSVLVGKQKRGLRGFELEAITCGRLPRLPFEIITRIFSIANEGLYSDDSRRRLSPIKGFLASSSVDPSWKIALSSLAVRRIKHGDCYEASGGWRRDVQIPLAQLQQELVLSDPERLHITIETRPSSDLKANVWLSGLVPFATRWRKLVLHCEGVPSVFQILQTSGNALAYIEELEIRLKIAEPRKTKAPKIPPVRLSGSFCEAERTMPNLRCATVSLPCLQVVGRIFDQVRALIVQVPYSILDHSLVWSVLATLPNLVDLTVSNASGTIDVQPGHAFLTNSTVDLPRLRGLTVAGFELSVCHDIFALVHAPGLSRLALIRDIETSIMGETMIADLGDNAMVQLRLLIELVHHHYPDLNQLSVDSGGRAAMEILSRPNEEGQWLLPKLSSFRSSYSRSDPRFKPFCRLAEARTQALGVSQIRTICLSGNDRSSFGPGDAASLEELQQVVPNVVYARNDASHLRTEIDWNARRYRLDD